MLVEVEAYHDGEFWCALGVGEDFFTQGKTIGELMNNIKEAAALHLEDKIASFNKEPSLKATLNLTLGETEQN